jgi:hypothetical protein
MGLHGSALLALLGVAIGWIGDTRAACAVQLGGVPVVDRQRGHHRSADHRPPGRAYRPKQDLTVADLAAWTAHRRCGTGEAQQILRRSTHAALSPLAAIEELGRAVRRRRLHRATSSDVDLDGPERPLRQCLVMDAGAGDNGS